LYREDSHPFVKLLPVRINCLYHSAGTPYNYIFGVVFIVCIKIWCEVSSTGFDVKIFGVNYV
jgi:hypothetical protein